MSMSPEEYFRSLPPVTKTYLCAAVGLTMAEYLGIVKIQMIILNYGLIFSKWPQIWRLVTSFLFFGKFGMPVLFQFFILGRYLNLVETASYKPSEPGKTAEMVTFLLFGAICLLVLAYFVPVFYLGPSLSFMVLYNWSRSDAMNHVSFWGFRIKQWHVPFVMLLMAVLMKSNPILDLFGIMVGHLWHFLTEIVPQVYGRQIIWTPNFIYRMFDNRPPRTFAGRGGYSLRD
mmetsp:Transcript_9237/g.14928  ORF Transcript_9237/g.14928 Transcript_9237/m.14928 type:complete len:230 (+) Transcript_9237:48-737(+)